METKEPDSRLSVRKEDLEDQELYNLNKVINDLYSKITTARDETDSAVKKFTRSGVIASGSDQSTASIPPPIDGGIPQPSAADWTLNPVVYSAGEDGLQYGFASAAINNKPAGVDYYSMFIQDYSSGYVDVSGTAVSLTAASKEAGNTFENCIANQTININSVTYTIASINTTTYESLTLTASAGTQSNVYFSLNPVDGKWEEIASDAESGTWQPRPPTGWDVPCCLTASTKDQKTFEPPAGVNYKRLQFAAWGDAPQVTNFSVSLEEQDPSVTDIPSGKFVVNFTKPLDPEYYYASIERLWYVNAPNPTPPYWTGTQDIGATARVDVSGSTITYNGSSNSSTFTGQYFNYIQPGDTVYIGGASTLTDANSYIVSEVISNTQLKLTTSPPSGTNVLFAQWGRMAGEINPFTQVDYWPLPTSPEYWKFRVRSVNHREIANNTAPPETAVTVPASGGLNPTITPPAQLASGDWSLNALQTSIDEAGNSSIFVSATITNPSATADYYSLFWQKASTPVSGDWIEIAADATAGTWQEWPSAGATYVVAIAANKYSYKLAQPDETIASYYKTLTIPAWGDADQVTGFSVTVETDNRAGVPSGRFVFNFTKPADPDYYYAQISRIATDSSYVPLPGAVYGIVAGEVNPTKQTDWWPLPETAEYWTFKVESVNYRKVVNATAAPISNVSVSTSSGITQIAPATITTAAFASTIRPVEIVNTLPTVFTNYPEGSVVFLTTNDKLYRSTGSAWTVATDGADIVANSITGGKIAAGAISTTELFAGEILVGQGGGKPTRFTVKDSVGNTIGFIGDNGAGFVGAYLINLRVGTDINNPVILASSSGVSINGAPLTLNLNGITTVIDNTLNSIVSGYAGLRIHTTSGSADAVIIAPGKIAMSESLTATTKFFLSASTGADTTMSLYKNGGGERIRLSANSLGGIISLYNGSGVLSSQLSASGITGVEIDLTTAVKIGGITVVDSSRNGSFANITATGTFTAGGSTGTSGQLLASTGTGVQWQNIASRLSAGTGVTITGTTTATIAIGQAVGTTSSVTFGNVTSSGFFNGSSTTSYYDTSYNSSGAPYRLRGSSLIDNSGVWISAGGINMNAGCAATGYNIFGGGTGQTATLDFTGAGGFTVGVNTYNKMVFTGGVLTAYTV